MTTLARLRFCKIRRVKSPRRAHPTDAGLDFFVPDDAEPLWLLPGEAALIPSGLRIDVPPGWALLLENKSGPASRLRLSRLACVVDAGYQGEVHLNVVNTGISAVEVRPGDKLLQGLLLPVGLPEPEEVAPEALFAAATPRGAGGFGSTGT